MEDLLKFLNSVYPLSPGLIEHFAKIIKHKIFKRKEYLLKAGWISQNIYFIHRGLLRGYYLKNETEVSSWFLKEGELCISIKSFYAQIPSFENIQALEDTEVFYITHKELEDIYNRFMEFNYVGRVLTIKYHELWADQLYGLRMLSAAERYQWLLQNHNELALRVPAKYISSWLDITEVTFSKMKNNLLGNGIHRAQT